MAICSECRLMHHQSDLDTQGRCIRCALKTPQGTLKPQGIESEFALRQQLDKEGLDRESSPAALMHTLMEVGLERDELKLQLGNAVAANKCLALEVQKVGPLEAENAALEKRAFDAGTESRRSDRENDSMRARLEELRKENHRLSAELYKANQELQRCPTDGEVEKLGRSLKRARAAIDLLLTPEAS